jgi:phosphatidylglycerophosphate synthase
MNIVYNYLFNHNYQPKNAGLIDKHFVYPISHLFSGAAYHLGITPNQITLTTFIIRSYANYNLYYKIHFDFTFGLFIVSWFTDALDGIVARKYNMQTPLGAILDGSVDCFTFLNTAFVLIWKYHYYDITPIVVSFFCFLGYFALLTIKLRNAKYYQPKPWEKFLSIIPVSYKSNFIIDAMDPGVSYLLLLSIVYYSLYF